MKKTFYSTGLHLAKKQINSKLLLSLKVPSWPSTHFVCNLGPTSLAHLPSLLILAAQSHT